MINQALPQPAQDEGRILGGAALRAAGLLGLSQASLAEILGMSAPSVSRMASGSYVLEPGRKEWEHAALFVRLFRSLDAITGSNDSASRDWLRSDNRALGARPVDLIRSTEGLVRAVHYLDAARGRV
jgi:transcriptional regulator with XRE-family HTH domain